MSRANDLGLICLKLYDDDDTLGYDEIMMMFDSGCGSLVIVWDCYPVCLDYTP